MKRMVFKSVAKLVADDPIEVFWLAGLVCNERNEWKVRTVYRNKRTGEIISSLEPIGMLPLLTLGTWFNFGELKTDNLPGEQVETIVPDVGRPEIITSADLPLELYPLPMGKAGNQRLFRYRTVKGDVLIPAIELVRVLFVRNRALALAMMRPAGLEQLYVPMELGQQDKVKLQFTKEMPKSAIGRDLAMNFAWIILDRDARKSWDSVLRNTTGQSYTTVVTDDTAAAIRIWQTGDNTRFTAVQDVFGVNIKYALVMSFAVFGEDFLNLWIQFTTVNFTRAFNHFDTTESDDSAFQRFFSLQTNDLFQILVDIASIMRSDG